jgi:signal transduction histidine kinase
VFAPFFTTKERGSGTGLGLYIVRTIVNKYGGTIEPVSQSGNGTTFRIQFPLSSAA